jgi:medium-chain acyl-[acyl-carrier-protein] hydrolase
MKFEYTSPVRYTECAPDLVMKKTALISRMEDTSVFHSESIGYGPKPYGEVQHAWIIVSWQILIDRMPVFNEKITTGTFAEGFRGFQGDRDFYVRDENGDYLARAYSRWIYYDFKTQRPMRVPEEEAKAYGTDTPLAFEHAPRHIAVPDGKPSAARPVRIRENHIDNNRHVNNLHYIEMAMACLKKGDEIREIRVEYNSQAVLGDVLYPHVYESDRETVVVLTAEEGRTCATVQFMLR